MPTTLPTGIETFKTLLEGVLSDDPDGTAERIREVVWGQGAPTERPIPFLAMQVLDLKRVGVVDGANEFSARIKLRIVYNVSRADKAHDDALRYIAQIEDLIDEWPPKDGVEGGEGTTWSITLPIPPSQGQVAFLEAEVGIRVRTTRGSN